MFHSGPKSFHFGPQILILSQFFPIPLPVSYKWGKMRDFEGEIKIFPISPHPELAEGYTGRLPLLPMKAVTLVLYSLDSGRAGIMGCPQG